MTHRDNYYRILDLDPDVLDEGVITARIKEKQRQWSKQKSSGPPDTKRSAAANLENLRDIERVMGDKETRAEESRAAKRLATQERQEKYQLLDEQIEFLATAGGYTDRDLEHIKTGLKGVLTETEIKQRLCASGLVKAEVPEAIQRTRLDPTIAKNIRLNLEAIGVEDLYKLLELPSQSSPKALAERADERYAELKRVGRTDTRSSARSELLGLCKRIFSSAVRKSEYDLSLSEGVFDQLKPHLDLAGRDRYLSIEAQSSLIALAVKRGARPEFAEAYIRDYAATRKWGLQRQGREAAGRALRLCGYCGALADPSGRNAKCSACGEPLEEPCPRCQACVPTSSPVCPACGCNTGDASLVRALMSEGEQFLAAGALAEARRTFERVLTIWADWEHARAALKRLQERADAIEREIAAIDEAIGGRALARASALLEHAERRLGTAPLAEVRRRLAAQLAPVAGLIAEGRRLENAGDKAGAIGAYTRALTVQSDCADAERALARCPPLPASGLAVETLASGFALAWQAGEGAMDYLVVRKAGGYPNAPDDGTTSRRLLGTRYSDRDVPVGRAWYYAVYACRGQVVCGTAVTAGPYLLTADVDDLKAVPGDGRIALSWTRPSGCVEVAVRRAPDRPPAATEGLPLVVSGDCCVDSGLANGKVYGYRVTALFADPERPGAKRASHGLERTAIPVAPPQPVRDLRHERRDGEIYLMWTQPARGRIQIHWCESRPAAVEGDCIDAQRADRFGPLVPMRARDNCRYTPTASIGYFLPLTIDGDLAVVGRVLEVNTLDPVSNLQAHCLGTAVALTWDWPTGVQRVLVLYRYDRFPNAPDDPAATSGACTRSEYDRNGCWTIYAAEQRPHYFALFAAAGTAGPYADAVRCLEPMGQEHTVRYALVKKRLVPLLPWVREVGLQLRCDTDLTLADLVLVGKPRTLPLSASDGRTIKEIGSIRLEHGLAWIPIDRTLLQSDTHVKLFFRDRGDAAGVRLQHAGASTMRLGR